MNLGLLLCIFLALASVANCCKTCRTNGWSKWGSCRGSCGTGKRSKHRHSLERYVDDSCPAIQYEYLDCTLDKCPIACFWKSWSSWSECTSCGSNSRTRVRTVNIPAHFGGRHCYGKDVDYDISCPQTDCPKTRNGCPESDFLCLDGLTCIKNHLKCNGDNDCSDNSDELGCDTTQNVCQQRTYVIANMDVVGAGFDITRGLESGNVLDNYQYNGRCTTIRSSDHGGKLFRKPANFQYFRFQVEVDNSINARSFDSLRTFYEEERQEYKSRFQGVGSYSRGVLNTELNTAVGSSASMRKIFQSEFAEDFKYFRIRSRVVTAKFRTLRRNLMLSVPFRRRVLELPDQYDYGKYVEVIHDFGTHFYSSGKLGGQYELIYRYSRADLKKSGLTDTQQRNCLEAEFALRILPMFKFGSAVSYCSSNSLSKKFSGSFSQAAQDVISNVKGGSSGSAGMLGFLSQNSLSPSNYQKWVETVKLNPAVIDYVLRPISSAMDVGPKRENMEKALYQYMKRFDPIKCRFSCYNGGKHVIVNEGKECKCVCGPEYSGESCATRSG